MLIHIFQKGGPLMFALLACSLLSLTLILERSYFWWKLYKSRSSKEIDEVLGLLKTADLQKLRGLLTQRLSSPDGASRSQLDPVLTVMGGSLSRLDEDLSRVSSQELSEALQVSAAKELARMRSYQTGLDTVIMVAPLLGILGTVIGIIGAFDLFSHTGLSDVQVVTGGIAEALITTATGLVVAILTVVPSQLFQSRLNREKERMEQILTDFETLLRPHLKERL